MDVRLKVLKGSNVGKEVRVPGPQCLIGRSEECHIRPQSDAVSRRHSVIIIGENDVVIRDLNSRNGTVVNGDKIEGEVVLIHGDVIKIGPLEFGIEIEQTVGKPKRPKVNDLKDVIARTADTPSSGHTTSDLGDISNWLDEADAVAKARRSSDPETRQFRIEDTGATVTPTSEEEKSDTKAKKVEKKEPGKLPPRPHGHGTKDSRDAAQETLKKLFKRN